MSFGLGNGRTLEPGTHGIKADTFPPLPDDINARQDAAWLDPRQWFSDPTKRFEIEIGSGKGTFLLQQGELEPETNFLGIEWAGEFFAYAADRVRRKGMDNVRLLHGDATEFLRWRLPNEIASVIHLYFSDPWPKSRHRKRRVVQDSFLVQAHRVLKPGGELRIVTDHAEYWQWMEEHFESWTSPGGVPHGQTPAPWQRLPFNRPSSAGDGEVVGTNFERKYAREGRPFNATILRKR
jgi:tRNA (guanine-N7-)-methyltransferase